MASRAGFEPAAFSLGGRHSIQLSYRDTYIEALVWTLKFTQEKFLLIVAEV